MARTYIKDLKDNIGKDVVINGFIHAIRDQGGIKFLIIRDVTGNIQCVVLKSSKKVFEMVPKLTIESVVEIQGHVKEEKQAPNGFELEVKDLEVLSRSEPELPIPVVVEKGGEEPDATIRFDWRWIDLRRPEKQMIFKVWTEFEKGMRQYFEDNNFIQAYSPSFMNAPSESGSDVFEVNYFERKAYLAQSPQFYKQMAMAAGFEKIFMTGPVFRAEPSFTTRHMTEFTGFDFEMSYIRSHYEVMDEEEKMLIAAFLSVKENLDLDIEVPSVPFPRLTMAEAKEKLKEKGIPSEKMFDLSPEEEREISKIIKEETGHDFVFLTDYHIDIRPFYHMRYDDQPELTKSFDLLYKGVEVTTGAQREHRYDVLIEQGKEKGMDLDSLTEYLNFFRYGCPPHGGGGIGPGRLIMKMLDLPSVKEATFLPRDVKRVTP
jgi:aspartyl-tRNA synthetase